MSILRHIHRIPNLFISLGSLPRAYKKDTIPYFAQWESPELIAAILTRQMDAKDDPCWADSGALSREEYALWSHNICGMACLKMILQDQGRIGTKTIKLAKACMDHGGYVQDGDAIGGLFYKGFKRFATRELGASVSILKVLSMKRIMHELAKGHYVITSVHPSIRDIEKEYTGKKGGHLVLITGYDRDAQTITFHNPSGKHKHTQQHAEVSFDDFLKVFGEKGLSISFKS